MSPPSTHWKLGLFVVAGVALGLTVLVFLGARSFQKETVAYTTYFDESVQGLDVGSPVKFRGVTIGNVSAIGIAPDLRHVEVTCAIVVSQLESLKLLDASPKVHKLPFGRKAPATLAVPADLRMQLDSSGITGVKFVLMDFFDVATNPAPVLPFRAPDNYVAAASSTMKNVEDAVVKAMNRLPEITDQLIAVVSTSRRLLSSIESQRLAERAGTTIEKVDGLIVSLGATLKQTHVERLSADAERALVGLNAAVAHLDATLAKADGQGGLIASAQRATDSIGDLAGGARGLGSEITDAVRSVREAADSVQKLSEALETDSDMLVKGRAKGKP